MDQTASDLDKLNQVCKEQICRDLDQSIMESLNIKSELSQLQDGAGTVLPPSTESESAQVSSPARWIPQSVVREIQDLPDRRNATKSQVNYDDKSPGFYVQPSEWSPSWFSGFTALPPDPSPMWNIGFSNDLGGSEIPADSMSSWFFENFLLSQNTIWKVLPAIFLNGLADAKGFCELLKVDVHFYIPAIRSTQVRDHGPRSAFHAQGIFDQRTGRKRIVNKTTSGQTVYWDPILSQYSLRPDNIKFLQQFGIYESVLALPELGAEFENTPTLSINYNAMLDRTVCRNLERLIEQGLAEYQYFASVGNHPDGPRYLNFVFNSAQISELCKEAIVACNQREKDSNEGRKRDANGHNKKANKAAPVATVTSRPMEEIEDDSPAVTNGTKSPASDQAPAFTPAQMRFLEKMNNQAPYRHPNQDDGRYNRTPPRQNWGRGRGRGGYQYNTDNQYFD